MNKGSDSLLGAAKRSDGSNVVIDSPSPSEHFTANARKKSKLTVWDLIRTSSNRSSLFVLWVLLITYMFSQVDRYLQAITAEDMQQDQNWGIKKVVVFKKIY